MEPYMTLELVKTAQEPRRLDRAKWHKPLVSIIVTHFNYSDHIEDALLSLLDQTHENWECVVIDDGSDPAHVLAVEAIIEKIASPKITLVRMEENAGQIPAFFAGLSYTSGEFVCLLDPDDRYDDAFLEAALAAHLNPVTFCPIVSTDQRLLTASGAITGVYAAHSLKSAHQRHPDAVATLGAFMGVGGYDLLYFPAERAGWLWTSTSAMMFRRAALHYLRPHKVLSYRGSADSYLAQGAHLLGGTLFVDKPLVYRTVHASNAWLTEHVFSMSQNKKKTYGEERSRQCRADAIEATAANGAPPLYKARPKGLLAKWRRSFDKRWRRLTGAGQ
jgi:glycosyltransferase involved in cell wall biosynthesis